MIRNLFVVILPLVLLLGCTATVSIPQQSKNESVSQPAELTKPGLEPIPSDNIALTKDEPDLIITDIWVEGNIIYFKVKNAGIVPAIPTYSCLYVENVMPPEATSYVEALMPGDEGPCTSQDIHLQVRLTVLIFILPWHSLMAALIFHM